MRPLQTEYDLTIAPLRAVSIILLKSHAEALKPQSAQWEAWYCWCRGQEACKACQGFWPKVPGASLPPQAPGPKSQEESKNPEKSQKTF